MMFALILIMEHPNVLERYDYTTLILALLLCFYFVLETVITLKHKVVSQRL